MKKKDIRVNLNEIERYHESNTFTVYEDNTIYEVDADCLKCMKDDSGSKSEEDS